MTDAIHRTLLVFVLLLNGRDYLQGDGALRLRLQSEEDKNTISFEQQKQVYVSDLCVLVKVYSAKYIVSRLQNTYQDLTDLIRSLVGDEISVDFPELVSHMHQPCVAYSYCSPISSFQNIIIST